MSIGERIGFLLQKQHKKESNLAKYLNTRQSTVQGWTKYGRVPNSDYIVRICEFFNVSTDFLLTGHERELPPEAQLTEGYNLNGDKISFSEEESNHLRILINEELNKQVEVAVRKVLQSEPQKDNKKED